MGYGCDKVRIGGGIDQLTSPKWWGFISYCSNFDYLQIPTFVRLSNLLCFLGLMGEYCNFH